MDPRLASIQHTHSLKVDKHLATELVAGRDQSIDQIKIAEDHFLDVWSDVNTQDFTKWLIDNGHAPEWIEMMYKDHRDEYEPKD